MHKHVQKRFRTIVLAASMVLVIGLLGACRCKRCETETTTYVSPAGGTQAIPAPAPPPRLVSRTARVTAFTEDVRNPSAAPTDWPANSKNVFREMSAKYGPPDSLTQNRAVWRGAGLWKEIVVLRDGTSHQFPTSHADVLQQTIDYAVPADKFMELAGFDGRVTIDRSNGTLTVRCDREAMNLLTLNLAHEIITGDKTVEEADEAYARIARGVLDGTDDDYTRELMFEVVPAPSMNLERLED